MQILIQRGVAIGGNLKVEIAVLEDWENKLIEWLNRRLPEGAELLKKARNLVSMERISYLAQHGLPDTLILKSEEVPALLSEDFDTIATVGLISRSFPDFRPNEEDVRDCLIQAARRGFKDRRKAERILESWFKLNPE